MDCPDHGVVTRCEPLVKGHGHQSFVLETSSQNTLLLKIALRKEQLDYFRTTGQAAMLADYQRRFEPWLAESA